MLPALGHLDRFLGTRNRGDGGGRGTAFSSRRGGGRDTAHRRTRLGVTGSRGGLEDAPAGGQILHHCIESRLHLFRRKVLVPNGHELSAQSDGLMWFRERVAPHPARPDAHRGAIMFVGAWSPLLPLTTAPLVEPLWDNRHVPKVEEFFVFIRK